MPPDQVAFHLDGVVDVVDAGEHRPGRHQGRVDARLEAAVHQLGDGEQPDGVPQLAGVAEVGRLEAGDPLAVHLVRVDPGVERQRREDRQLVGRVDPLHVVGGIGLGVAEILGLSERRPEVEPGRAHPGDDVVGRAVDDRGDPADVVRQQVQLERPDDRDAAADARLVGDVEPLAGRRRHDRRAVLRHHLLVGRDDVLAAARWRGGCSRGPAARRPSSRRRCGFPDRPARRPDRP